MEASYDDIMDALETQYDDIMETEALLSELFSTTQGEKESVAEFGGWLLSIAYKIKQSQGAKGGRDDDQFVQQNFFWGLKKDVIREALRLQLDKHESFNALLKEAGCLESDYERHHTKKARANAVTIPENNVSDRDWLEERFQKMESGLRSHV